MTAISCRQALKNMDEAAADAPVFNYFQCLDMSDYLIETELFSKEVLDAYSTWNLGLPLDDEHKCFFNSERGGGQGDYREHMPSKIANVVDCLTRYPVSKRAVITVPNTSQPSHESDDDAKCMREIHFRMDEQNRLCATVLFRAQAVLIFPKNIHFIGRLMEAVAHQLPSKPVLGELTYLASVLVSDRS